MILLVPLALIVQWYVLRNYDIDIVLLKVETREPFLLATYLTLLEAALVLWGWVIGQLAMRPAK